MTARGAAVITGASRGIGRATAIAFAQRGLDVALIGRDRTALQSVGEDIGRLGAKALAIACDVSQKGQVEVARSRVLEAFGPPVVVVNNAGIAVRVDVEGTQETDWDNTLGVNLKGPFLVTQAFLSSMRPRKIGRFVAVGSISGTVGTQRLAAYCASKWGLVGFTKALAEELRGSGLAAMIVQPGSADTDMLKGSGFTPAMRPEAVAEVVVYLGLDAPLAMNGAAVDCFGP